VISFITNLEHNKLVMAVLTFTSGGIAIHNPSLKALVALSSSIAALAVGGTGCGGVRHRQVNDTNHTYSIFVIVCFTFYCIN
jgi:hypothetical protein